MTPALVAFAIASGFGTGAASAMNAFYVESSVAGGMAEGVAGAWLVVGGACGILGRLVWGRLGDHLRDTHLPVVATLMALGAAGLLLIGLVPWTPALLLGTIVAFGAGWGWNGLFVYAIVRSNRDTPAAATGITQAGVYVGGIVGPPTFGLIAQHISYGLAWSAGALSLLLAAAAVVTGGELVRRGQARHAGYSHGRARGRTWADDDLADRTGHEH